MEQIEYSCKAAQKDWETLPSIDFKVQGKEGIRLTDAMNTRFGGLEDRDLPMFEGEGTGNTVSCRLNVRGRYRVGFCCRSTRSRSPCSVSSWGTWEIPNQSWYA